MKLYRIVDEDRNIDERVCEECLEKELYENCDVIDSFENTFGEDCTDCGCDGSEEEEE